MLYVSNEEDATVSFVDLEAREVVEEVDVGEEPEGVQVSPDGRTVYVTSETANMVHVIDTETAEVLADLNRASGLYGLCGDSDVRSITRRR